MKAKICHCLMQLGLDHSCLIILGQSEEIGPIADRT